jgi:hypothetical protein
MPEVQDKATPCAEAACTRATRAPDKTPWLCDEHRDLEAFVEREHERLAADGLLSGSARAPTLTPHGARAVAVEIMREVAALLEQGTSDADISRHIGRALSDIGQCGPENARAVERHLENMFAHAMRGAGL